MTARTAALLPWEPAGHGAAAGGSSRLRRGWGVLVRLADSHPPTDGAW